VIWFRRAVRRGPAQRCACSSAAGKRGGRAAFHDQNGLSACTAV